MERPGGVDPCPDAMHQAMTGSESEAELYSAAALREDVNQYQSGARLASRARKRHVPDMSTQEMLLEEIKRQPEPVSREVWHYLKFPTRQREEEAWANVLPTREVEQEVLDLLDGHEPAPR